MKAFLRFNFISISVYLLCIIYITSVNTNKVHVSQDCTTRSLSVTSEEVYSEDDLIERLSKTLECLKRHLPENKGRQDDDDDDDFQLPSYVPEIIKVVGSVLAGNASSLVGNSLSLIDNIPGAGGSQGGIASSVSGLLQTLVSTINESRPLRLPTKPPRHKPTRGPTRKPPMRNRTRRSTTRSPLLNQITDLMNSSSINSVPPSPVVSTKPPSSESGKQPIIFVLPNLPNGISVPDLANNPNFLTQVVNQSIQALKQPGNNYPNQSSSQNIISQQKPLTNPMQDVNQNLQTNSNLIQQEQQNNQLTNDPNQTNQTSPPSSPQSVNNDIIPNPNSPSIVSTNGNFTFVTSQQSTLGQEQLLSNLLNILTKLSQQPTISPPLPVPQSPLPVTVSATNLNASIPTTTEDEYYYYEDEETTTVSGIAGNGTANAIKATTTASGDDDDDDGVIIKAGEANSNKTTEITSGPIQSFPAPTTTKTKNTKVTTVKTIEKDKDAEDYDEDYDSVTSPKTISPAPVITGVHFQSSKITTKLPAIENDEEEAEAQPYSTLRSKVKATIAPVTAPPPASPFTTEDNEEDYYEENEKTTTQRKYIYSKTTAKTLVATDEDDTENLFKVKARFK